MRVSFLWVMYADLTQRAMQKSYMFTLLFVSLITLFCFPDLQSGYQVIEVSGYRGVYNAQWMGTVLALLSLILMPLFCFYLIKNAIEKDRQTGLGELIAATDISNTSYLFGKLLSSIILLSGLCIATVFVAMIMQYWIGEDYVFNLAPYILPQIVFVLPVLVMISACALLFETIPFLRGGVGNIAYFFIWVSVVVDSIAGSAVISSVMVQMEDVVLTLDPNISSQNTHIGISKQSGAQLKTFIWQGITYTPDMYRSAGLLLAIGVVIFAFTPICFDRFRQQTKQSKGGWLVNKLLLFTDAIYQPLDKAIVKITSQNRFAYRVYLEVKLFIKGQPRLMGLCALILLLSQYILDIKMVTAFAVPSSLLLAALFISPIGSQAHSSRFNIIQNSYPESIEYQIFVRVIAALSIVIAMLSGAFIKHIINGDFLSVGALITGIGFTVSLAFACGVLTKTPRAFEIFFVLLWYLGPIQPTSYLDFIGSNIDFASQHLLPLKYLLATFICFFIGYVSQKKLSKGRI